MTAIGASLENPCFASTREGRASSKETTKEEPSLSPVDESVETVEVVEESPREKDLEKPRWTVPWREMRVETERREEKPRREGLSVINRITSFFFNRELQPVRMSRAVTTPGIADTVKEMEEARPDRTCAASRSRSAFDLDGEAVAETRADATVAAAASYGRDPERESLGSTGSEIFVK